MKKLFAITASVLMTAMLFAGCSSEDSTSEETTVGTTTVEESEKTEDTEKKDDHAEDGMDDVKSDADRMMDDMVR